MEVKATASQTASYVRLGNGRDTRDRRTEDTQRQSQPRLISRNDDSISSTPLSGQRAILLLALCFSELLVYALYLKLGTMFRVVALLGQHFRSFSLASYPALPCSAMAS